MTEALARFDVASKKLEDLTGLADHMEKRLHLMQSEVVQKAKSTADTLDERLKKVETFSEKEKESLKNLDNLKSKAAFHEARLKRLETPWLGQPMPFEFGRSNVNRDGTSSYSKTEKELDIQISRIEQVMRAKDPEQALQILTEAHEEERVNLMQEKQSIEEKLLRDLEQTKAKLVEGEKKQTEFRAELQALKAKYDKVVPLQTSGASQRGATAVNSAVAASVDMPLALKELSAKAMEVETKAKRLDQQLALLEQEKARAAGGVEMQADDKGGMQRQESGGKLRFSYDAEKKVGLAYEQKLPEASADMPLTAENARVLAKKAEDAEKRAKAIEDRVAMLERVPPMGKESDEALTKKAEECELKARAIELRIMELEKATGKPVRSLEADDKGGMQRQESGGKLRFSYESQKVGLAYEQKLPEADQKARSSEKVLGINYQLNFQSQQKVDEECQLLKQKLEKLTAGVAVSSRGLGSSAAATGEAAGVAATEEEVRRKYDELVQLRNQVAEEGTKTSQLKQENLRLSMQLQQIQQQGTSKKASEIGLKSRIRAALTDAVASGSVRSAIDQGIEDRRIESSQTESVRTDTYALEQLSLQLQKATQDNNDLRLQLKHAAVASADTRGMDQLNLQLQQKNQENEQLTLMVNNVQQEWAMKYDQKEQECRTMQQQIEQIQATQRDLQQPDPELERSNIILQQQLEALTDENTAHHQRIESLTLQLQQAPPSPPADNSEQGLLLQQQEQQIQQLSLELMQLRQQAPQQAADQAAHLQELTFQLDQLSIARQQDQAKFSAQLQQKEEQCQQQAEVHRGECEAFNVELAKLRREPPGQEDLRREMSTLMSEKKFLTTEISNLKVKYEDMAEEKIGMEAQLERGRRAVEAANTDMQTLRVQMQELEMKKEQIQVTAEANRKELEFQLEAEKQMTMEVRNKYAEVEQAQIQLEQGLMLHEQRILETFRDCSTGIFRVDNSRLNAETPGLNYRMSKSLDVKVKSDIFAPWGCLVPGIDEEDGWLLVGSHYLPFTVNGFPVLSPGLDSNLLNRQDVDIVDFIDQLRGLYMDMRASLEVCHKTSEDQAEQLAKMRFAIDREHKVHSPAKQVGQVDLTSAAAPTPTNVRTASPMVAPIHIQTLETTPSSPVESVAHANVYSQPPSPPAVETHYPTIVTRGGGSLTMPGLSVSGGGPTVAVGPSVPYSAPVTPARAPGGIAYTTAPTTRAAAATAVEYVSPAAPAFTGRNISQPGLITGTGLSGGSFTASPSTPAQLRAAERFIAVPTSSVPGVAVTTTPARPARPSAASMQLAAAGFAPPHGAAPVTQSRTQSGQSTSSTMARGIMASLAPARPA